MTSSRISSSHALGCTNTLGTRNVCVSSADLGGQPAAEVNADPLCLLDTLAHANRPRVCSAPLGRPSLCMPQSCNTACPLPGTCDIPGTIGVRGAYGEGFLNSHEKLTMQFLNDRLASYLEKVRQLEGDDTDLEKQILERSKRHESTMCGTTRILCIKAENAGLVIQVDNAELAVDDFGTNLAKADLEAQQEPLKEKQLCLKSNREQEVNTLRRQLGDKLRIELDAVPTMDLGTVLEETRCLYEAMVETHRRDGKQWFQAQSEGISLQATSCSEELQRCRVNALEAERQVQQDLKDRLQNSWCDAEARFGAELAQTQTRISNVEEQLSEIPADLERQNQEYQVLLDVQAWLEGEIATYWNLRGLQVCSLMLFSSMSYVKAETFY
uniref:IF rod domain-containing protein n=1 Tax=Sus scrofa TaxID=9823 RepID=A0A8D0PIQ6_PIG